MERIILKYNPLRRVVRSGRVLLKVRVFGNMGSGVDQSVADQFATAPAKRKNRVYGQQHGDPWLVRMANFVNTSPVQGPTRGNQAISFLTLVHGFKSFSHTKCP